MKHKTKTILHWGQTMKSFKRDKRRKMIYLRKALHEFRFGAAYLPGTAYIKFSRISEDINDLYDELKPWWKKA